MNDSATKLDDQNPLVQYFSVYFSGQLNCHNCGINLPLDASLVNGLVKSCILTEPKRKLISEQQSKIKRKFMQFINSFNSNDKDMLIEYQNVKWFEKLNLQNETTLFEAVPLFYYCINCDITGAISKWEIHVEKLHLNLFSQVDDFSCVHCICTVCNTLVFGVREKVIQHCHFSYLSGFFLFAYPHLSAILQPDCLLPRYYTFQNKVLESDTKFSTKIAFYCLSCDIYGLEKPRKHFESNDHKFKTHPMFEIKFCETCSTVFYSDQLLFEDHIRSPMHVLKRKTVSSRSSKTLGKEHDSLLTYVHLCIECKPWQYDLHNQFQSYCFWCESCSLGTTELNERLKHLNSDAHKSSISNGTRECFVHLCIICKMCVFGSPEEHSAHAVSEGHIKIRSLVFSAFNLNIPNEIRKRFKPSTKKIVDERVFTIKGCDNKEVKTENSVLIQTSTPISTLVTVTKDTDVPRLEPELPYNLTGTGPFVLKLKNVNSDIGPLIRDFIKALANIHGASKKTKNYCFFCQRYFSSNKSWWFHLKSIDHSFVMKESNENYMYVVFCYLCGILVLGTKVSFVIHCRMKSHKINVQRKNIRDVVVPNFTTNNEEDGSVDVGSSLVTDPPDIVEVIEVMSSTEVNCEMTEPANKEQQPAEHDLGEDQDELYNMLVKEESDAEKSANSDDDLHKILVDEVKILNIADKDKTKGEEEEEENQDYVEYSIIVRGIPKLVLKNKPLIKQTFSKYVLFDRSFTKKSEPGSLYLVVTKEPEESFKRMTKFVEELKQKFGTDELFIDYKATKNDSYGIKELLSEKAVMLFSNLSELRLGVCHMIHLYDNETINVISRRQIQNLEQIVFDVAYHIYKKFDVSIRTHIFGSRVTGLASERSDVDIYLQIGPTFRGLIHKHVELQQQLVLLFAKQMSQWPREFDNIVSIPFARVPILKFTHLPSNLNCDLSFKSGLSTMNSYLVKAYLQLDSRIKFLICALKMWMKLNDLADRNLFTTYAQIWMVLFFLMQPDIAVIPTVLALRHMLPVEMQNILVENWNCAFPNFRFIVWRSSCTLSPEQLLYRFFAFYGNASLNNYVLCTLTGLKIEKKHFLKLYENLPNIFQTYKIKMRAEPSLLRKVSSDFEGLCVQDPFDHCHNLTKAINSKKCSAFTELCKQTTAVLKNDT